jgi:hypothetical protein
MSASNYTTNENQTVEGCKTNTLPIFDAPDAHFE